MQIMLCEDHREEPTVLGWRGKTKEEASNPGFQGRKERGIEQKKMKVQVC